MREKRQYQNQFKVRLSDEQFEGIKRYATENDLSITAALRAASTTFIESIGALQPLNSPFPSRLQRQFQLRFDNGSRYQVRLPDDLDNGIEASARANNRSKNSEIQVAIGYYLSKFDAEHSGVSLPRGKPPTEETPLDTAEVSPNNANDFPNAQVVQWVFDRVLTVLGHKAADKFVVGLLVASAAGEGKPGSEQHSLASRCRDLVVKAVSSSERFQYLANPKGTDSDEQL